MEGTTTVVSPPDEFRLGGPPSRPVSPGANLDDDGIWGGDDPDDFDPQLRLQDVERPRPGSQSVRTREDEFETFYCRRTEQRVTRDRMPTTDLLARADWQDRHFGEARWHTHAPSQVINPLTGKYNVRPKVTTAVFERMLQTEFATTHRSTSLYVLLLSRPQGNDMHEYDLQMADRLLTLARLVSQMGFTDNGRLSLGTDAHKQAKLRLLARSPSLKSTLDEDHASPFDPYIAVLNLPYHRVQGLLGTLQSKFGNSRAVVAKFDVAPEDVELLGHFWRDDTSDPEARTGTLLPEQKTDCFGRDIPRRLSGPTTRTVHYYDSPEGYHENGLATGRPANAFQFPALDPKYTSWARHARPTPRRSVTRHVLAQDPGSLGTGIPRNLLVVGRPDIGPGRDPVNDHGIYQDYFVCCGQSVDNEGCLIDVYDARTNKSRAYKIFTHKDARRLYAWIGDKMAEGLNPEALTAPAGLIFLASIRRGTAWVDRGIYDRWHAEILDLAAHLARPIVQACIGLRQGQDWMQDDILEYVPYFLPSMPDVIKLYTLVATYNGYRCAGASLRALPQSPVEWLQFLVLNVLHMDALTQTSGMIRIQTRIEIIGKADPSLVRAQMFTRDVMTRIARMTKDGERILKEQEEVRVKREMEREQREEVVYAVAVPPPASIPQPSPPPVKVVPAPPPTPVPTPSPQPSPPVKLVPLSPSPPTPVPTPSPPVKVVPVPPPTPVQPQPVPQKATPVKVVPATPPKPVQPEPLPVLPPLEPEPQPAPKQPSPKQPVKTVPPRPVKKTPSPAPVVVVVKQPPPKTKVVVEVTPQEPQVVVVQPATPQKQEPQEESSEFGLPELSTDGDTEEGPVKTTPVKGAGGARRPVVVVPPPPRQPQEPADEEGGDVVSEHDEQQEKVWSPSEVPPAPSFQEEEEVVVKTEPPPPAEEEPEPLPDLLPPAKEEEEDDTTAQAEKEQEQLDREKEERRAAQKERVRIKQEEDARVKQENDAKRAEEAERRKQRVAELNKKREEARAKEREAAALRAQEEAEQRRLEAERKAQEEAEKREAARLKAEQDREQRRLAEEQRRKEEEARREAERLRAEEEREQRRLEEETRRKEDEAKREAERLRVAEVEQQRRLQEEQRRKEEAAQREADRLKTAEVEQQRRLEAEERRKEEEAARLKAAEVEQQRRLEAEEKRKEEEEARERDRLRRQKQTAEKKAAGAEKRKKREEQEAEERRRKEEEAQRLRAEEAREQERLQAEKKKKAAPGLEKKKTAPVKKEEVVPVPSPTKIPAADPLRRLEPATFLPAKLPKGDANKYGNLSEGQISALMYFRDMLRTISQPDAVGLVRGDVAGGTFRVWNEDGSFNCNEFNDNCLRVLNHILTNDENVLYANAMIPGDLRLHFKARPASILMSYIAISGMEYRADTLCGVVTNYNQKLQMVSGWSTTLQGAGILKLPANSKANELRKCVEIAGIMLSNFISLLLNVMTTEDIKNSSRKVTKMSTVTGAAIFKPFFAEFGQVVAVHRGVDKEQDGVDHQAVVTLQSILNYVEKGQQAGREFRRIGEELFNPAPTLWEDLLPEDRARLDQMLIEAPSKSQIYDPITPTDEKQAREMAAAADTLQNIELKQRYVTYGAKEQGKDVSPVDDWNEAEVNKRLLGPVAKTYVSMVLRLGKDGYVKKFVREDHNLADMGRSALAQTLSTDQLAVAHIGQEKFEKIVPLNVLKDIGLLVPTIVCDGEGTEEEMPQCGLSITVSSGCSKCPLPGFKHVGKHGIDEVIQLFHRWGILAEIFSLVLAGKKVTPALREAIAKPWHHSASSYRAPPASVREDIGAWAEEYGEDEDAGITEEVAPVYSVPPSTPAGFWSSLTSVFTDDPANDPASIASWGAYEDDVY
jgi:hypothetical protein